jgi:UDP-2,3-diacylglucosamine pyrophosphatase LpxH
MKIPRQVINLAARFYDGSISDKMYKWLGTEKVINKYIKAKGYDCAITGHTHSPKITPTYMNCGDWTDKCTALIEHIDGTWELYYHKTNITN